MRAQIVQWLVDSGLGLRSVDRVSLWQSQPRQLAHKAIAVTLPETVIPGPALARTDLPARDTLDVQCVYRIRPHQQQSSVDEALDLESQIIQRLTTNSGQFYRLDYLRTRRSPHPQTSEYYLLRMTFRVYARQILLGES